MGGQKTRSGQGTSGPHEQTTKHHGTGYEQEVEGNTPPTGTVVPDGLHTGGTKSTGTTNKIYQSGNPIPGARPLDSRAPAGTLCTDTGGAPGLWHGRNPKGQESMDSRPISIPGNEDGERGNNPTGTVPASGTLDNPNIPIGDILDNV